MSIIFLVFQNLCKEFLTKFIPSICQWRIENLLWKVLTSDKL